MPSEILISEYYKKSGAVAKLYKVEIKKDSVYEYYYSIVFKNENGERIDTKDYKYESLRIVEDLAEDWALEEG